MSQCRLFVKEIVQIDAVKSKVSKDEAAEILI